MLCRLKGQDESKGVQCEDVVILYKMIWQDVREAVDYVHHNVRLLMMCVGELVVVVRIKQTYGDS